MMKWNENNMKQGLKSMQRDQQIYVMREKLESTLPSVDPWPTRMQNHQNGTPSMKCKE